MKLNLKGLWKQVLNSTEKHAPELLIGVGTAALLTTTVLAVKATPKAVVKIEDKKKELKKEKLTPVETVKTVWKDYIPATVSCTVGVACIVAGTNENLRRNAALATAYQLSQDALTTYKDKVVETIGEKKEKEIRDSIDKDRVTNNPPKSSDVIVTGNGKTLCYDAVMERYFECDIHKLKKAEIEIGRRLMLNNEMYASLNDFYDEINAKRVSIGDDLGWCVDDDFGLSFSSQLTEDDVPVLVVDFRVRPRYDYKKVLY